MINDFLDKKPLVLFALSYFFGILAFSHTKIISFFLLLFLAAFLLLAMKAERNKKVFPMTFLCFLFFASGLFRMYITSLPLPENHIVYHIDENKKVDLVGKITAPLRHEKERTRFILKAEKIISQKKTTEVKGKVRITIYQPSPELEYKDNVVVKRVRLHPPSGFRNFRGFNYREYMKRRGIYVVGGVSKTQRVQVLEKGEGGIQRTLLRIKEKMSRNIDRELSKPANSIIKAMVLGERGFLDKKIIESFQDSGIAHLLAVSGLHLGFVALASFFLIYKALFTIQYLFIPRWLTIYDSKKAAAFLSLFPLILYSAMVGYRVPTFRAGIMIAAYLIAFIFNRHRDFYNIIALAFLAVLFMNPLALYDIGFQLSFIAVTGIVISINHFTYPTPEENSGFTFLKKKAFQYFIISVFASLSILPVVAFYFNKMIFISPLSNFIIVPIASLVIPLTLLLSFLGLIYAPLFAITAWMIDIPVSLILMLSRFFASLPFSFMYVPKSSFLFFLVYYTLVSSVFFYKIKQLRKLIVFSVPAFLLLLFSLTLVPVQSSLSITFLDVGHGDSAFIRTPEGKNILVDGGGTYSGSFEIGKRVVLPFLLNHGVRSIDLMIATHPHPDHLNGLIEIAEVFKFKEILMNKDDIDSLRYKRLEEAALKNKAIIKTITSPYLYEDGELKLDFIHPSDEFVSLYNRKKDENNHSLVFRLVYKDFSILFTGDAEKKAEDYLVQNNLLKSVDILKAGHHGSKNSSGRQFLEIVKPKTAVISAGRYNWFRFPSQETIEKLKERDIRIYRTDKHGSIRVLSNGINYSVQTYEDAERSRFRP